MARVAVSPAEKMSNSSLTWQGQRDSNNQMESIAETSNLPLRYLSCADREPVESSNEIPLIQRLYGHPPRVAPERVRKSFVAGVVPDLTAEELHHLAEGQEGYCYFIGGAGLVKIGYAANVSKRLAAMQVNSPVELELLAVAKGGAARESAYHLQFRTHRIRGEWYERCPAVEAEIERLK